MRIAVADVLGWLAAGMTYQQIIADYPELTEDHIRACLAYAADRERRLVAAEMKLPFDPNLSFKLCRALTDLFPGTTQVGLIGLADATDRVPRAWKSTETEGIEICGQSSPGPAPRVHRSATDEEPPRRIISARPQNLTSSQPVVQRCGLTRCAKPPFADATSVYSISSSVSAIRLAGISSPRDLAAFILMTSSYLVGCRTGRSAGLAPLRIFPT